MTPKQVATVLGLSHWQVRTLVRNGRLRHVLVGARRLIPRNDIEQFISENTVRERHAAIPGIVLGSSTNGGATTSSGQKAVAAASEARARAISHRLKSPSANSSERTAAQPGRVIPLKSK
jgi:excisionase family DNA binding protein